MELLENGTAIIVEHRDVSLEEGTELFIYIEEKMGIEVIDFHVEGMTEISDWDSLESREEKEGHYTILDREDGVELVWGIGDYGRNQYTLTYVVSNVVTQLHDGQSMHWDFNTYGTLPPEEMAVSIRGPFSLDGESTRIWGFGYDGRVEWSEGEVLAYSEEPLYADQRFTVLVQFLDVPFLTSFYQDRTMEQVVNEAQEDPGRGGGSGIATSMIALIVGGAVTLLLTLFGVLIKIESLKKEAGKMPNKYEQDKRNKGMYYTEIPYKDGEMTDIAFLLKQLGKGGFEHYFSAFLLKWAKEGCLRIDEVEGKRKQPRLVFLPESFNQLQKKAIRQSTVEQTLWSSLLEASNEQQHLSNKEMKKWAEKQADQITAIEQQLEKDSMDYLAAEHYITEETLSFIWMRLPYVGITKKGQRLYDRLTQFDQHLSALKKNKELSYRQLIPEESFLIWASLFGKEEEVISRLDTLMPEWQDEEVLPHYFFSYSGLHTFSSSMHSGYVNSGQSSASGFSGSASVGGGGGAVGGGGGGVR
ncbi:Threonyl-tRNA synthetase [Alkalibacterium sp. AK22]|nr:Threonyl-tRNA synthetase [Alkalibacterium sp. AK22]